MCLVYARDKCFVKLLQSSLASSIVHCLSVPWKSVHIASKMTDDLRVR